MLQTVKAEKLDEKNGVICLISMFPSWVIVLKLSKRVEFTYMHLKSLIMQFQKIVLLIMLWLTVSD